MDYKRSQPSFLSHWAFWADLTAPWPEKRKLGKKYPFFEIWQQKNDTHLATKHTNHVLKFGAKKCFIGLKIAIFRF